MSNFSDVRIYEPPEVALSLRDTPRFGESSTFDSLFGSNEERQSYLVGLIFAAALIIGVYLIWAIVMIILMCCFRWKVGFWSGVPFLVEGVPWYRHKDLEQLEAISNGDEDDYEVESRHPPAKSPCCNRPMRVRSVFLVSGAIFLTFSILIVTQGLSKLQTTVNILSGTTGELNSMVEELQVILEDGIRVAAGVADRVRGSLETEITGNGFCPANPLLDNSDFGRQLQSQAQSAVDQLQLLDSFLNQNLDGLESALQSARVVTGDLHAQADQIDLTDWQALLALIPFSLVPALLMAGTIMAAFDVGVDWYRCLLNWVTLPIFILLVTIAMAIAAAMVTAAAVNGDFCLPGGRVEAPSAGTLQPPDRTIYNLLLALGLSPDTIEYQIALLYISQCTAGNDPFAVIRQVMPDLQTGASSLQQLTGFLATKDAVDELSLYCNKDFSGMTQLVLDLNELVRLLVTAATRVLDLVACERIVPLYVATVYDGMCTYSPQAIFWVFASTLVMGVMGMIMITLRSSYKETRYKEVVYDPYQPPNENDMIIDEVEPTGPTYTYRAGDEADTSKPLPRYGDDAYD